MKFTLSWLKDHLETTATVEEITEALTDLGLEVEGVDDASMDLGGFTIARVVTAAKHPGADKLKLCSVEIWPGGPDAPSEVVQVVCGAKNAEAGMLAVFAAPGVFIPKWLADDKAKGLDEQAIAAKRAKGSYDLSAGVVRGEASNGMLCSAEELLLTDTPSDGIISLPKDAPLGVRYVDHLGLSDPVIEIAITPNRPDACGVYGVARDLAARGLGTLKSGDVEAVKGVFECPTPVAIAPKAKAACAHFTGRFVRGVKNGSSPDWLQRRLKAIGLTPKNTLVDITNYINFDRARPLHVFDANKLEDGVRVRPAKDGEKITALDDKEYELSAGMTLVCDKSGRRPEAIAGVMGGKRSACSEETTDVFIEAAYFDPIRTAETGRKLKINSDSRFRFERGVDPEFTQAGLELATRMVLELCGGEPSEVVVAGKPLKRGVKFKLDTGRVDSLVGMNIPKETQLASLKALGFEVTNARQRVVTVVPPSWRPDVHGEADLVEEIARIASLTKLPAQPLARSNPCVLTRKLTPMQERMDVTRRTLAVMGMNECVSYSFIGEDEAKLFGGGAPEMRLENPISSEMSEMRPSLLPGLLAAAARNQARGYGDVSLFEVGPEFFGPEPGEQREVAAGVRVGATAAREWSQERRGVDLYDAKADAEAVLSAIGAPVEKLQIDRNVSPWFHPGRAARLKLGPKNVLAEFGELHPKALKKMGVRGAAVGFSVNVEAVPTPKKKGKTRPALLRHDLQAVERDFAFVVDARCEAETILRAARGADKALIEEAYVFDVFDGAKAFEQLGEGKKSVAIAVKLQPTQKTLTDQDIDKVAQKIVAAVEKSAGGVLRG